MSATGWLRVLGPLAALLALASPARAIIVYDLTTDFSNTSNPNGVWSFSVGNVALSQFTPVPGPLATAASGGYWGLAPANLNDSVLRTTANGSTTGLWSDSDFLSGQVLVHTSAPSSGAVVNLTWTAPTAGTFTYNGYVWYADAPSGPGSNDFVLSVNAGPALESGTAGIGQDFSNVVGFVNGAIPVVVNAGDQLTLALSASPFAPFGSLAGVHYTIDFTPVPEPGSLALLAAGGAASLLLARRRLARSPRG